jgi:hypothetical protein
MKILKIFEEKLRYKNYSDKSIRLYASYLKLFLEKEKIKDPYHITPIEALIHFYSFCAEGYLK